MTHKEKLEYLVSLQGETISPTELAKVLGGRPFVYNVMAKDGTLKLPFIWRGRNLRVFKQPVLELLGGDTLQKK